MSLVLKTTHKNLFHIIQSCFLYFLLSLIDARVYLRSLPHHGDLPLLLLLLAAQEEAAQLCQPNPEGRLPSPIVTLHPLQLLLLAPIPRGHQDPRGRLPQHQAQLLQGGRGCHQRRRQSAPDSH